MTVGRPSIEITEKLCQKAESLAAQGLTMEQIATVLGMATGTVYKKQAQYSQFSEAIKAGRQKGIAVVTNALMETAKAGNVAAQIFYLKNRDRDNWKDAQDLNVKGKLTLSDLSDKQLDQQLKEALGGKSHPVH